MATEKEEKKHSKLPIYCVSERFLEYEEWFAEFEDDINIELAETGADRELDFDSEQEFDKRYEMYVNARVEYMLSLRKFSKNLNKRTK